MKRLLALMVCVSAMAQSSVTVTSDGRLGYPGNLWSTNAYDAKVIWEKKGATTVTGYGANIMKAVVAAARSARATELYHVNVWGDSYVAGTPYDIPTWFTLVQRKAQKVMGDKWAGYGYCPAYVCTNTAVLYERLVPVLATNQWITTGFSSGARGPSPTHMNTTNDNCTLTWTFDVPVSVIKVLYVLKPTGAKFNTYTNGVLAVADTDTAGADNVGVLNITAGLPSAAGYTLTVESTNTSVSSSLSICGVFHQSTNNGVLINNLGVQGATATGVDTWLKQGAFWSTALRTGLNQGANDQIVNLACYGVNDRAASTTTQFKTALNSLMQSYATTNSYFASAKWVVLTPAEIATVADGAATARPTLYWPAIAGQIVDGTGGDVVEVINMDHWFGSRDKTYMARYYSASDPLLLHPNHLGAGILAANICDLLGL